MQQTNQSHSKVLSAIALILCKILMGVEKNQLWDRETVQDKEKKTLIEKAFREKSKGKRNGNSELLYLNEMKNILPNSLEKIEECCHSRT